MGKNWEVEITYVVTVAVEDCDSEDDAFEWAENELGFISDLEMMEGKSRIVPDEEWESVKRHAAKVAKP